VKVWSFYYDLKIAYGLKEAQDKSPAPAFF
jgi:hypothetical protein